MAERSPDLYIDRTRVGHLRERDGIWAFEYSPEWLAEPLDRLAGRIGVAAEQVCAEAEAANAQWAGDGRVAAALAGEMRCLRALRATVIAEMASRLAG
ncbi:HipA N-terminal domain-containing protein [Pigmentiphaga soli]